MSTIKLILSRNQVTSKFEAEVNTGPTAIVFTNICRLSAFKDACDFIENQVILSKQSEDYLRQKRKLGLNSITIEGDC